ncbi:hypothetical protein GCM10011344_25520 [Dokdonia pacifica]|uniref:Tetratricopeptide repeat-containing protein n=1 Tax=Dokdonia pacifica TaxID=1627892 RepID=A0A238WRI6_9FLAO|nr:SIR2 family protein [Dokdonia pacifica]GGG23646.1 hypothetical protein GCM10011344_25520 [Dokdonia pacifica]SNR49230.1 Tetratricopeptide repeat-containing protein [Dokdonia pacifica]
MIEKIKDAIKDDSLILFVGAGMSIPFGFPNWADLIQNILEKLHQKYGTTIPVPFDYFINQGNNVDVFKVLSSLENENCKSEVNTLLYEEITSVDIKDCDFNKQEKLWQISDKIITTNYDKVLEKKKPEDIPWFSNFNEFQQSRSLNDNPFLYKIHGDINNPDKCIFFESDYKKLYDEDTSDKETLKTFLKTKTILFLGFSMNDPFITKQIEYLYAIYSGYNRNHYILQTKSNSKDLRKHNLQTIPIDNWNDAFDDFLDELVEAKKENSKNDIVITPSKKEDIDISKIKDTILLEKMFDEKKEEFDEAEDHLKKKFDKELRVIKDRMIELRTKQFNFDFKIPDHDLNELEHIFETIYNSEILSDLTKGKINKIKNVNEKIYQWYHRSVIVSALACSLVNHHKIDIAKIDLLIDFVNESEPKVWQKAITYLFIVLNFLGNRWIRYKKKLESKIERLKLNLEIQESLRTIIYFMQIGLQRENALGQYVFENKHFKNNPFNYFLPFFKGNPSVDKLYDNENIEDIEGFIEFLYDIPLPDSFKYLVCNEENIIVEKKSHHQIDEGKLQDSLSIFTMHITFEPYLNYASEFLNFYENHPDINKSINEKGTIVEVKNLKNYLLNTIEHHRALGRQFMIEEQWGKAITHYQQLLVIKENDILALKSLITCFENKKNSTDDRLELRLKIENIDPKDHENLFKVGVLYNEKKKYKTAIKYFDKAIILEDKKSDYYGIRASSNRSLGKLEDSLKDHNKSIEFDRENAMYFNNRGNTKFDLKDYEGALRDYNKSIELDDKSADTYINRAGVKVKLKGHKSTAINDCDTAIQLDNKNGKYFRERGNIKFDLKDYEGALKDYNYAINKNSRDIDSLNNRGLTKDSLGDYENSLKDYDKIITLDPNDIAAYTNKANSLRKLNQINEALETIAIAQELNPEDSMACGTKAAIYASHGDDEKFYEFLEKAFQLNAKANWLDNDIKEKYKNEKRFQDLLKKYDQTLEEE